MAEGCRGHRYEGQAGAFPKQLGGAVAERVKPLNVKGVLAGAQAERAAVKAHGVAGSVADLGKGRTGLGHFHTVDHQPGSIARHQIKGITAIGWNIQQAIPRYGIASKSLSIGLQVQRLAPEYPVFAGQVWQLGPRSGVDLKAEPGQYGADDRNRIVPAAYSGQALGRPILLVSRVSHLQQNAEAPRTVFLAVQFGSHRIGKAVMHLRSASLCAIAKKPCVTKAWLRLGGECHILAGSKHRRVNREPR